MSSEGRALACTKIRRVQRNSRIKPPRHQNQARPEKQPRQAPASPKSGASRETAASPNQARPEKQPLHQNHPRQTHRVN
jgi:hypothetical protein